MGSAVTGLMWGWCLQALPAVLSLVACLSVYFAGCLFCCRTGPLSAGYMRKNVKFTQLNFLKNQGEIRFLHQTRCAISCRNLGKTIL